MDGSSAKLNKTIVILTPGFPSDEADTTCIPTLQDYVATLHSDFPGLQIIVLTFQYPYRAGWYKWSGIDVFSARGKDSKIFRLNTWMKIRTQLKRIHRRKGIDILHSFWLSEASLLAQQFARSRNIKHIATLFGQDALPSNKYLRVLNLSSMTIIANSEFTSRTLYKSTHHRPQQTIHFGLIAEKINNAPVTERAYDIIGVGSLIKLKNYPLFLEIIGEVKRDHPRIKALLIGEGYQRNKIEGLIRETGLQDTIEMKGSLPRNEVFNYLGQSKIFLHTSGYESAGYVFLESLAYGCELVCFDIGFVPPTAKSHVCSGKDEMIQQIKSLLAQKLNYEPVTVPTMNETVQKFAALYSL